LPTSIQATLLVSALATRSVFPSGDSATEFGVDVGGCSGKRLVEICSIGSFENVSNTHTLPLLPHATNSRAPSGDNAIAFGCSAVDISLTSVSESAVNC